MITFGLLSNIHAQRQHKISHEKFKALKTAFITDELDLTVKEAEKFWPIYNEYHKSYKELSHLLERDIKKRVDNLGGIENLSDKDAAKILERIIKLKRQKATISEQLYPNLKKVISAKKIIRLTKAERDFRHKIFKEYRRRGQKKEAN
ncbi:MAG: sensor of ECF-type sigma factor [Flavobacteriaceae bacterium]|nr:MAG: sensor of ECF-type sigma factor [Flavobacteriaceae bacterium]